MTDNQRRFVEALESGKYKQGVAYLRVDDCYCALGVGADIYLQDHLELAWAWVSVLKDPNSGREVFRLRFGDSPSFYTTYPPEILAFYGMLSVHQPLPTSSLINMNDGAKMSFPEIAATLREAWQ